jgi:hypothetical protein
LIQVIDFFKLLQLNDFCAESFKINSPIHTAGFKLAAPNSPNTNTTITIPSAATIDSWNTEVNPESPKFLLNTPSNNPATGNNQVMFANNSAP